MGTLINCEAAAVRTTLTQLTQASTRVLKERFDVKLGVAFTLENVCLNAKTRKVDWVSCKFMIEILFARCALKRYEQWRG